MQLVSTAEGKYDMETKRATLSKMYMYVCRCMSYKKRLVRCHAGKQDINQFSSWSWVSMWLPVRFWRVLWTLVSLLFLNHAILCKQTSERAFCCFTNTPCCSCFAYGKNPEHMFTYGAQIYVQQRYKLQRILRADGVNVCIALWGNLSRHYLHFTSFKEPWAFSSKKQSNSCLWVALPAKKGAYSLLYASLCLNIHCCQKKCTYTSSGSTQHNL